MQFSALIVGCGNIAGGFDSLRTPDQPALTHAGAYTRHGGFRIAACVEPDEGRRQEFMRRWDVRLGFTSIQDVVAARQAFDVVSVCSPTAAHHQDVLQAIALKPRIIFCEKPATTHSVRTKELMNACQKESITLVVNYTRRWDPSVSQLASELCDGSWGAVRSATGIYTKGVFNNGSHMIDLVHILFGGCEVCSVGQPVHDFWPDDPTVPAVFQTRSGIEFQLACGHAGDFSVFELQVVTQQGVVCMEDGGLHWRVRRPESSRMFSGYRTLGEGICHVGRLQEAMGGAVAEIHKLLQGGVRISCSGEDALATQIVCESVYTLAQKQRAD